MSDFLEQFAAELTTRTTAAVLDALDDRLAELAKRDYKPFYTFKEMTTLFGVSLATLNRHAAAGTLSYTKNFNGARGCTKQQIEDYFRRMETRATALPADNVFSIKRAA